MKMDAIYDAYTAWNIANTLACDHVTLIQVKWIVLRTSNAFDDG